MELHKTGPIFFAPNWLGDCVMALPTAAKLSQEAAKNGEILQIIAKSRVADFWKLVPNVQLAVELGDTWSSLFEDAKKIKALAASTAYICPRTPRVALTAFFARVPQRVGFKSAGIFSRLFSKIIDNSDRNNEHQSLTYWRLLELPIPGELIYPDLIVPANVTESVSGLLPFSTQKKYLCVLPGAARGDSKRWPSERFAAVAQQLLRQNLVEQVLVLGAKAELDLCNQVVNLINSDQAICLAGQTTLLQLAEILSKAALCLCNDSGGMHLTAALKRPLIAIFGETAPQLTGPLGEHSYVLQKADRVCREISASSPSATAALMRIQVEDVLTLINSHKILNR